MRAQAIISPVSTVVPERTARTSRGDTRGRLCRALHFCEHWCACATSTGNLPVLNSDTAKLEQTAEMYASLSGRCYVSILRILVVGCDNCATNSQDAQPHASQSPHDVDDTCARALTLLAAALCFRTDSLYPDIDDPRPSPQSQCCARRFPAISHLSSVRFSVDPVGESERGVGGAAQETADKGPQFESTSYHVGSFDPRVLRFFFCCLFSALLFVFD
jgi:hypothetical protein